jgi:hypothetical protein
MNQPYIQVVPDPTKWKITKLEKITGERNGGRHNAFVYILDEHGNRFPASLLPRVEWTWVGRQNDQTAQEPQPKQAPDPYDYDIPLEMGVYASIWIRNEVCDKAHAVTAMLPDVDKWNTWGHHSWEITFQWVQGEVVEPPKPPVVKPPVAVEQVTLPKSELLGMLTQLDALRADVASWIK